MTLVIEKEQAQRGLEKMAGFVIEDHSLNPTKKVSG